MAKHTLKIFWGKHCKISKVCLAILQPYAWKGEIYMSPFNRNLLLLLFYFYYYSKHKSTGKSGLLWGALLEELLEQVFPYLI